MMVCSMEDTDLKDLITIPLLRVMKYPQLLNAVLQVSLTRNCLTPPRRCRRQPCPCAITGLARARAFVLVPVLVLLYGLW